MKSDTLIKLLGLLVAAGLGLLSLTVRLQSDRIGDLARRIDGLESRIDLLIDARAADPAPIETACIR